MRLICETQTIDDIPLLTALPDGARRAPLVFILHGFGGCKEHGLELAHRLASRGMAVVAFDAVHHGQRADGKLETFDDPQKCDYPVESGLDRYVFMHRVVVDSARDLSTLRSRFEADARIDTARSGVNGSAGTFPRLIGRLRRFGLCQRSRFAFPRVCHHTVRTQTTDGQRGRLAHPPILVRVLQTGR